MDYEKLASPETVKRTAKALAANGTEPIVAADGREALNKIIELIPPGASVMNGTSRTLEQIGFVEYLKSGRHGWNNLHKPVVEEKDPAKKALLRKQALLADYFLGSVHALAEAGEFIIASNTGSQLPSVVYSSANLIFVVSTKKIVPTLGEAYQRLMAHVVPLEDKRMMAAYGVHTKVSKIVTFKFENPSAGRRVRMILVNENLGF